MSKYQTGDYIKFDTPEQREQIVEKLESEGYCVRKPFYPTKYNLLIFDTSYDGWFYDSYWIVDYNPNCNITDKFWDEYEAEQDLDNHLKQQEQAVETPQKLPEEFIITNADNLTVRQWLKDLGYSWIGGGDLTTRLLDGATLSYSIHFGGFTQGTLEYYTGKYPERLIITPNIGVTGFDITYPTPEKSVKEIEIENMKKQIFEMQESLKKLESEG